MASTSPPEWEALLEEREAALLADSDELEAKGNSSHNEDEDNIDLRAQVMNMNSNFDSILKRLSQIEATTARPAKRYRVAERTERDNQSPEAEEDISDSERLMPQTDSGENGEAPNTNSSEAEDDLLSEIAQEFSNEATTGPNVSQQLADILNQRWSSKLDESKLKSKMEKHDRPENCEKLSVPKVNPEIWSKLQHTTRGSDLRLANFQKTLVKVRAALTKSADSLLNIRAKQTSSDPELKQQLADLVTNNMDALAVLGHVHVELTQR